MPVPQPAVCGESPFQSAESTADDDKMPSESDDYNSQSPELVLGILSSSPGKFSASTYPSKAGGRPVWLKPPPPRRPTCANCLVGLSYVLQLYAPLSTEEITHEGAFHRTLYLFVCKNCGKGASVLRAQLPRENAYYPVDYDDSATSQRLVVEKADCCSNCGCRADARCGRCGRRYCGRECQRQDWRTGHKDMCGKEEEEGGEYENESESFDGYAIFIEAPPESAYDTESGSESEEDTDDGEEHGNKSGADEIASENSESEAESARCPDSSNLQDAQDGKSKAQEAVSTPTTLNGSDCGTMQDATEKELPNELFRARPGRQRDTIFDRFCRLTANPAAQVVRYRRNGHVLWALRKGRAEERDIKPCEKCGGRRIFEFQVLPQLIYLLEQSERQSDKRMSTVQLAQRFRDEKDWATVAVYTCENSCEMSSEHGDGYAQEVAWVQAH